MPETARGSPEPQLDTFRQIPNRYTFLYNAVASHPVTYTFVLLTPSGGSRIITAVLPFEFIYRKIQQDETLF